MGRKLLVILVALLVAAVGCAGPKPPGNIAVPGTDPTPVNPPAEQPQPQPVEPLPQVRVKVWAVDPAGQLPAELLFESAEPLMLEGVSPDGRYWLFEKIPGLQWDAPRGFSFLLDRTSGALVAGPQLNMHPAKVAWSGRGFWVNDLIHLGLDLKVETYDALVESLALGPEHQLMAASFTADGSRVALVVANRGARPYADLIWAEATGKILARVDNVIQPLGYFGKTGPFVYLAASPAGDHIVLMSESPGIALIDTAALDPAAWRPLLKPFVPPVPLEKSHGGPAGRPLWAPDGRHLWVPDQSIVDVATLETVTLAQASPWAVWKPDGTALVTGPKPGTTVLSMVTLDGQVRDSWAPEWAQPVAFLPDGRLLVACTMFSQ